MSEPHIIRLRGPWELQPLARYVAAGDAGFREETGDLPPGGKVSVPGDWGELLGPDFIGRARYTRRFNCPTNLQAGERVWLALDGVDPRAEVALNGQPIGQAHGYQATTRFDITPALQEHNVLAVEVCMPGASFDDEGCRPGRAGRPGGLIGEVRLEIGRGDTARFELLSRDFKKSPSPFGRGLG
jgi:beta-galactosidase/beta-glucuronidase